MPRTTLSLSSKNYSSWSLRGWLMARLSGIDFDEVTVAPNDADARAEILLLSPSILVPCLTYKDIKVWDTLAIGEFLNEIAPKAGLLPKDQAKRAHCRSICGEMHSGFVSLRQALPMNIKANFPNFKIWSKAQAPTSTASSSSGASASADYGGPFLFGEVTIADAMYAPVVTRFRTYDVKLDWGIARPTPTTSGTCRRCRNGARRRWPKRRRSRSWRSSFSGRFGGRRPERAAPANGIILLRPAKLHAQSHIDVPQIAAGQRVTANSDGRCPRG